MKQIKTIRENSPSALDKSVNAFLKDSTIFDINVKLNTHIVAENAVSPAVTYIACITYSIPRSKVK